MPLLLVAFILAFMITKTIQDAKTDRALAEKGIVSPRLQAKYGDQAGAKTARYGMVDYLRDAWSDNWERATEARRAATVAAKTAEPVAGRSRVRFRDRLAAARGAVSRVVDAAAPVVRKLVDPVPARADRQAAELATPDTAPDLVTPPAVSGPACPDCGEPLTASGGGWDHPGGAVCAATGHPYRPARPLRPRPGGTVPVGGGTPATPPPRSPNPAGDFNPLGYPPCGWCGRPAGCRHVSTDKPICTLCVARMRATAATVDTPRPCARCGVETTTTHFASMLPICGPCVGLLNQQKGQLEPYADAAAGTRLPRYEPDPEGEKPMTAPTGEAVNYETTVAELEAIAAEQRKQIDAAEACLKSVEDAKSHIDGMQDAARSAAEASASVNDHLAALNLDSETLGHVGTAADALPASTVDRLLAQLEEVEVTAREYLSGAEVALAATEAALATVHAKYADAAATVQGELGGDARFLDGGAGATVTPASVPV